MLKAVLEQDQPANRPMVLCVSAIAYKGDGKVLHHQPGDQQQQAQQQQAVQSAGKQAQVQLTDGWYGVKAVLDQDLTRLVQAGNLKLGMLSCRTCSSSHDALQNAHNTVVGIVEFCCSGLAGMLCDTLCCAVLCCAVLCSLKSCLITRRCSRKAHEVIVAACTTAASVQRPSA